MVISHLLNISLVQFCFSRGDYVDLNNNDSNIVVDRLEFVCHLLSKHRLSRD